MTYSESLKKLFQQMNECQNVEVLNFIAFCLQAQEAKSSATVWLKIRFVEAFELLKMEANISLEDAAEICFPQKGDDSLECEQFHAYVRDFKGQ